MNDRYQSGGSKLGLPASPRFCERCRRSHVEPPVTNACPECGDGLVPQGYCTVCEDFWRLPVGSLCPKHDLKLETHSSGEGLVDDLRKSFRWVTVCRFTDSLEAQPLRIRLEAEGIPTFVDGERMGSRSMYHVATGGVKLKVPEHLASDARIILCQTWSATAAALDIEDEIDDHDFEVGSPQSGSAKASLIDSVLQWILLGSLLIVPVVAILYLLLSGGIRL
jgi:hypothetical protein